MAVAVEMSFAGATLDQYEQVIALMGFTHGGKGAPRGLFHWVAQTDDGLRVVDVWETKEDFERFAQEHIGPATKQAGVPEPTGVEITEIHNYLTAG